jgi:arabinose-5-phosphate isomerase
MLNDRDSFRFDGKRHYDQNPKLIPSTAMVVDALNILEDFSITQLWSMKECTRSVTFT